MRQVGVLAAAGLIALEEMPARLGEDHANARLLAEAVAAHKAAEIDLESVQTNIVIFKLPREEDVAKFCAALQSKGVLARGAGPRTVRLCDPLRCGPGGCASKQPRWLARFWRGGRRNAKTPPMTQRTRHEWGTRRNDKR